MGLNTVNIAVSTSGMKLTSFLVREIASFGKGPQYSVLGKSDNGSASSWHM